MKILFVCLGNICRSPAAEESLRVFSSQNGLQIEAQSCGVGEWHIGKSAYQPMIDAAEGMGFDLSKHRARCVQKSDFDEFDFLIAMDEDILAKLQSMAPASNLQKVVPYLIDENDKAISVPDPYYTEDFEGAMRIILDARPALIDRLAEVTG